MTVLADLLDDLRWWPLFLAHFTGWEIALLIPLAVAVWRWSGRVRWSVPAVPA